MNGNFSCVDWHDMSVKSTVIEIQRTIISLPPPKQKLKISHIAFYSQLEHLKHDVTVVIKTKTDVKEWMINYL